MSGEENLQAVDTAVIVSLWSLKFFDNWLQELFDHTSKVIYGDFVESASFQRYVGFLLLGKCALACVLAIIVDAYNHKFFVAFGGTILYILTPVFALCMIITEARIFCFLTLAVSSIIFVTSPAAFGVIFNQKKSPVRVQVRRLVSIMEFVEGLLQIVVGETIPEKAAHSERYSMIVSWFVILPFFIFILTILDRIRKYVTAEKVREKGVVAIFEGIQNDIRGKGRNTGLTTMSFLFFVILLLPAFSLTSLGSVVANLKSENDTQFQHPSLKKTIKFGQLTVIPLCEVAVSFSPLKELLAEMLVLGMAHVLNIGVLTFLVVRMNSGGGGNHRSVIVNFNEESLQTIHTELTFPSTTESMTMKSDEFQDNKGLPELIRISRAIVARPDNSKFIYYSYNPTPLNITLSDDPPLVIFNPLRYKVIGGILVSEVNVTQKELTVRITVRTTPAGSPPPFSKTIKFVANRIYCLILTGNTSRGDIIVSGDDIDIPESIPQPILTVMNSFVGGDYWGVHIEEDHELTVLSPTGIPIHVDMLPRRTKSLSLSVPEGNLTLLMRYAGSDPTVSRNLPNASTAIVEIDPYTLHIITVSLKLDRNIYWFNSPVKLFELKALTTTPAPPAPPEPQQPDAAMQTTYAMIGVTIGLTSVGYIHFFWMGCPIRLRATLYAWFLASNEIMGWTAAYVVGEQIGVGEGIGLLAMAVITAAWHFVFGLYYERKILPDALEKRRGVSPSPSSSRES